MWSPKFGGAAYVIGPGSLGSTHGPSQPRSEMDPFASTTFSQNHVLQAQPPETRWHLQTAPNQAINDSETSDIHTRQPSRLAVMQSPTCQCCTVRSANRPLRLRRRQDPVSASLAPSSMSPRPTRSCRDPPHVPREVVPTVSYRQGVSHNGHRRPSRTQTSTPLLAQIGQRTPGTICVEALRQYSGPRKERHWGDEQRWVRDRLNVPRWSSLAGQPPWLAGGCDEGGG